MSNSVAKSKYTLKMQRRHAAPTEHPLEDGRSVFVGTSDTCGIKIQGDGVAGIHCLVDVEGDELHVQDWASDSGTKINGQVIDDKTRLNPGDRIQLGSIEFQVHSNAEPGSSDRDSTQPSGRVLGDAAVAAEHSRIETSMDHQDEPPIPTVVTPQPVGRLSDSLDQLADPMVSSTEVSEPVPELQTPTAELDAIEDVASIASELSHVGDEGQLQGSELPESEVIDDEWDDDFGSAGLSDEDLNWDPSEIDDEEVDAEIVQLLKSEIEDLRIQVAERDEQLAALAGLEPSVGEVDSAKASVETPFEFEGVDLVQRVDDLLGELAEHDEKVSTLEELLQVAEVQNQAEREERSCLENWVGEIEQRIGERESEWQAEQDALRERLTQVSQERDQTQQQLHAAAQRYGAGVTAEVVPDDTLEKLQQENAELQEKLDTAKKQLNTLAKHVERLENEEPEDVQQARAELAREKASVSRMRFQLSQQLQEINEVPEPKDQPDREFALKLQTLREHLREIHEEEKSERDQKGDSLFGRISSLWKRVDDEY